MRGKFAAERERKKGLSEKSMYTYGRTSAMVSVCTRNRMQKVEYTPKESNRERVMEKKRSASRDGGAVVVGGVFVAAVPVTRFNETLFSGV